ncbi:IclR family transcriptional regulator [Aeromonas cavernicola]|uniref:HTH-type transcriptional repressor AllR n=1 Tax=Aeromonas cavernicola TaxID=1006623 RepID=A0A2H9U5D3_9GAMM|nr:IclR family transcriptional regulator [Aeromonas cavernicola]PJG59168.1 IclR family transcriptional regulator [Aeromonas cavernicola]
MSEKKSTTGSVQSIERAFELLETIADAGHAVTLSQLASTTHLPLPTIHRLLGTLVTLGYARQLPNRRYSLGSKLIRLGDLSNKQMGAAAVPHLKILVDKLGESANMAILDAEQVVYVAQAPSPHSMRMFTEVGHRASLHNTGVGKALLAQMSDDAVRRIVAHTGLPAATEFSITHIDDLLAELGKIRQRGYAIDDREQAVDVRCFSIAIPNAPTPTAISVSGPITRVDEVFGLRAVPILQEVSRVISAELNAD